jgi:Tol biopolymer transport system component
MQYICGNGIVISKYSCGPELSITCTARIWRTRPDGGSNPQLLLPAAPPRVRVASSSASTPSGSRVAFHEVTTGNPSKWDLWTILLDGPGGQMREPDPFQRTDDDERESDLSPDGRWVAYAASEGGGPFDIYVRTFPDSGQRWRVSSDGGGVYPQWSASRSTLFFVANGLLMAAPYSLKGAIFAPASQVSGRGNRSPRNPDRTPFLIRFQVTARASSRSCPMRSQISTRDGTSRSG